MERLLTVSEVAKIINCSPSTIYSWAESGKIPKVKINGLLRFHDKEIYQFLESFKQAKEPFLKNPLKELKTDLDSIIKKTIASEKKGHYNSSKGETRTKLSQKRKEK